MPDPAVLRDRKAELEKSLAEFDAQHDALIRRFSLWVGKLQRRGGRTALGRWFLRNVTTRLAAWAIVRFRLLTIERPAAQSAVEVAYQWQKLALFMRVPIEIESADDRRVVLIHNECSVGFRPGEEAVCLASMTMDRYILAKLGATISTTERISAGGTRCRHVLELLP